MTGPGLDPVVAQRVAALSLRARKVVEGLLTGIHKSPHRGASVVFAEHREYRPGDDPRLLDWRAYARTDRHSIKRFEQETQLRATLVLDRSGSMAYADPPGTPSKVEHAATLLMALGYVLVRQGDAAGAMSVDSGVTDVLPPRSRPAHLDALLTALGEPAKPGQPTDLAAALEAVAERAGRRAVVAIASDLLDLNEDALQPLATMVSRGNEVIVLHVMHPSELELPFRGPARFVGLEGEAPFDADPEAVREAYRSEVDAFVESCRQRCLAAGARYAFARTDEPPEHTLAALLARGRRGGWGG
ncbi:MAG: DUF58 domain-containing protein [Myxococcota bacterium]